MGILQRIERKLESTVDDGFARVFGGKVAPQEVENALQREAEDSLEDLGDGTRLAPNRYVVRVGDTDFDEMSEEYDLTRKTFSKHLENFIRDNGWQTYGDVVVELEKTPQLHTGMFRAHGVVDPDAAPRQLRPHRDPRAQGTPAPLRRVNQKPEPGVPAMSQNPGYDQRRAYEQGTDDRSRGDGGYSNGYENGYPNNAYPDSGYQGERYPDDQRGAPYGGGQAYSAASYRDDQYPDQRYPEQGRRYDDQGYADQRHPDQNYGDQNYGDQGYADQHYAGQGYGDQRYPDQPQYADRGYGDQGYADRGYADQGYADQRHGDQHYGDQAYGDQGYAQDYGRGGYDQYGSQYGATTSVILSLEDGSNRTFALREGTNIVGRGQDAQFRLPDTGVSRRHVEVRWDGHVALLTDLNSTNGTTVNDVPVSSWELADGDRIRIGHSDITVHFQ